MRFIFYYEFVFRYSAATFSAGDRQFTIVKSALLSVGVSYTSNIDKASLTARPNGVEGSFPSIGCTP